jgi:3-dehydroquinate dehydratase
MKVVIYKPDGTKFSTITAKDIKDHLEDEKKELGYQEEVTQNDIDKEFREWVAVDMKTVQNNGGAKHETNT